MKDTEIELDTCVKHKETATELYVEYYHEHDKVWVGTDENDHDWFFEAADVEPVKERVHNNHKISDRVHSTIPVRVRDIVEGHLEANEKLKCQHNREILDEIIADLRQYASMLPSVDDLEVCSVL